MESEGVSQAAASELEGAKEQARTMLLQGASVEQVIEASGLNRPTVLGLYGAIRKKAKRISKSEEGSPGATESKDDEEGLVGDFQKETKITNSALSLARSQQRLKSLDPAKYQELHGGQQSEGNSPSRALLDLEIARLVRTMRQEEEGAHRNNGGEGTSATENLRKEIDALRAEMHQKDLEALQKQSDKLESEISSLREDMRHSNSNSDLAVVFRESKDLLEKVITNDGVLRRYLLPDNVAIKPPSAAPALQRVVEDGRPSIASQLARHGLVTRVLERQPS